MNSKYCLPIIFCFILSAIVATSMSAATIKSTPDGGNWNSTGTWIGGKVPGAEDDVIIDSRVVLDTKWDVQEPDSCLTLTVTEIGILENQVHEYRVSSLSVSGNFINSGYVKHNPDGNMLTLFLGGDILNYGEIDKEIFIIASPFNEISRITGTFINSLNFDPNNQNPDFHYLIIGKTVFEGDVFAFAPIVIDESAELMLTKNTEFFNVDNNLSTKGILHQESQRIVNLADYDPGGYCELIYHSTMGDYMDATLRTYGSRTHPRMSSAVSRWWRLSSENEENLLDEYYISFTYEDDLLNGLDAAKLEVFHSSDEGNTWAQISKPGNIQRNLAEKTITVGNELFPIDAGGGDFILSIANDDVIIPPSISIAIVGRDEIRIGAPNNYKIVYWNNGNLETGNFFVELRLEGGVEINTMLTRYDDQSGTVEYYAEDMNPYNDKTYGYFLIDELGPGEYSSFDLVLDCLPDNGIIKPDDEPQAVFVPVIYVAAKYVGTALLKDYLTNVVVNTCSEITSHDNPDVSNLITNSIVNGVRKTYSHYTWASPVNVVSSAVAGDIVKGTTGIDLGIFDLVGSVFQCLEHLSIEMRKAEAEKELEKVNSFDPNSKSGPEGYGEKNFMATISPMAYTIDFENLAEATASAYKVVIEDVLDETLFDISTVEFLGMSHEIGTYKIEGNKLIWEFVEIELPPNKNPPEGEGWVTYKVNLHKHLVTGTEIRNTAKITFDLNEPIVTNETLNILDFEPPITTPYDLPQVVETRSINIEWRADDGSGSGIDFSYVYVSANNSPFNLHDITDEREMQINVSPGNNYRFFVLSKDNVGNVEKTPSKMVSTSTIVSVEKIEHRDFITVFPNPAGNQFNIFLNLATNENIEISIFDILGNEVYKTVAMAQSNDIALPVDSIEFTTGMYFIRIKIGERIYHEKVMIY